jgi:hypothetical protein
MFSGGRTSSTTDRALRFWSTLLSAVLAITLLQVAPPANAAAPLFVDLVTRADDVVDGQSVLLGETQLLQTSPSAIYRLDIVLECGLLDHIGDIPVAGVTDIMGSPITWSVQSDNANFVGTPEKLEQVLDNLRIIRETGDFGYVDCPLSRVSAWLVEEIQWLGNYDPQGTASYVINDSRYPLPTLTTFDTENNLFLSTSRLNTFSNGFEIEWDQFEGSLGYTPAGYSLRYREVFNGEEQRGPWIYQRSADGRQKSLVVQDPLFEGEGPAFQYEVEVAPSVIDCDSNVLFGKFESIPFVGGFGLNSDPSSLTPNIPQMIEGEVVSQCLSPCVPTETVAFDGEKLGTILEFTSTDACTWTVPSNFTSGTLSAYVVGGGGGGGAAGGGGGGGGGFETSVDLPIEINDTWTVRVGTGGVGSDLFTMRGDSGSSSSVTHPSSTGDETITALGGGGGGTKDNSGDSSGGDGIYTGAPLRLTYGGYGSGTGEAGAGVEGIARAQVSNEAYGDGGEGGGGSALESSFIAEILASGGGGGAKCLPSGHEFYADYLGGISLNSGIGGSCQLPEGSSATASTGGGGGGGASDGNGAGGTGGDGGSGVVFIVHTEEPLARYIPSGCDDISGVCNSWEATNGNQNLTATVTGAPFITSTGNPALNGSVLQDSIPVVQGIPSDSIVFPASVMPDNYTLFTVARYNEIDGGQYQRIFDGKSDGSSVNWLSGFWGDSGGYSGVAFHGNGAGWLTPEENIHDFDWVVSTDQNNLYRSNGTTRSYGDFTGGVAPDQLTINGGDHATQGGEASDFQVADIIVFDYELSTDEYLAVEKYLGEQYGICSSSCSPLAFSTDSQLPDGDYLIYYSQPITATGPAGSSITYSVVAGELPIGLSLDSMSGEIYGAPETSGTFTFTVEATNTVSNETVSKDFTITINEEIPPPPPDPPVFTTTSPLLSGETGTPYLQTIEAISPDGNTISYVVIDILNFPPGLTLDSSSGVFSGTPETSGTFTFTIEATDDVTGEDTREDFTITINEEQSPPPDLTPYEEDVDFGRFKWFGVGAGIGNVAVQVPVGEESAQVLGSGSMRAYWIPNLNADPLTDGIEILCADTPDSSFGYQAAHAEVICPEFDLSQADPGLTAQIKRNFAASDPWHQISVVLTNSSDSEAITGLIAYRIDLTSGPNTAIAMTSDGDLELENTDKWFLTRDSGANSRPVSLHYFGDLEDGRVSQDDSESGAGKFWIKKFVTVPAASNQTHRFIDGFTDLTANAAGSDSGQAVIVAMKAADQLEYQTWTWDGASDVLTKDLSDIVSNDRDLPALRIQYDCRDFGRSAIYPVVVQNNGQPIGCNIGLSDGGFSEGMGGPGEDAELDAGLYPSDEPGDEKTNWIQRFRNTFPNATPRLGWACDSCIMTSAGPEQVDLSETPSEVADGLPLGFTTNAGGQDNLDSVRILPQGIVQLHSSEENDPLNGVAISAFGNTALGNGSIQGTWDELPEYDYFYWGRTEYQGRLAFVVTWVKMPSLDTDSNPISGGSTTMQLMLVSDSDPSDLGDYFSLPEERQNSNVDIIWNYDSIQPQGAVNFLTDFPADNSVPIPFYAGIFSTTDGLTPLVSDAFTTGGVSTKVGLGEGDCVALCVSENLLENRLQSPVNGRYVIGLRTYEILTPDPSIPGTIPGLVAPAAPRSVQVSRTMGDSAIVSWQKPVPWVISWLFDSADGINPILGYRIEYAANTRGESTICDGPGPGEGDGPGASGCYTTLPELDDDPLSATSETVTVTGSGDTERLSITIPELDVKENYTFRVFAVYSGIDFPDDESESAPTDMLFGQEVRSAPATANEQHDSELQIVTVATDPEAIVGGAQGIAGFITGNLDVTNATINGSPFAYGQTAKSIATFSGGEDSIGFDSGIVIAPLVDARTFQRGSGITETYSSGKDPSYFADPNHRAKYFESANKFSDFLNTQESFVPGDGFKALFDCEDEPDCANGTTVLQFDIEKPEENDFLKFEYVLAGLEATDMDGPFTSEVYEFPDGFGLFVGDINQESSCALVPQVDDELPNQRFMSMGNALNARLATEVEFNSDLNAETVSSVMSCNFDVSEIDSETITITMAIANANDNILSTAVFIKSESLRFEPTSINSIDIPVATQFEAYEDLQFTTSGTAPASWTASGLPDGMNLTNAGALQGTPIESGTFDFTISVLDESGGVLATQTFTILIDPSPVNVLENCNNPDTESFVVMFSNGTFTDSDPGAEDANLLSSLCGDFDVQVFDGGDFSPEEWLTELEGSSALVFPESNIPDGGGTYRNKDFFLIEENGQLLFSPELVAALRSWNDPTRAIIFTGGYSHLSDISQLLDVEVTLEATDYDFGSFSRAEGVSSLAPENLPQLDFTASLDFSSISEEEYSLLEPHSPAVAYLTDSPEIGFAAPIARTSNINGGSGYVYYFGFDWAEDQETLGVSLWGDVLNLAINSSLIFNDRESDRFLQGNFVEVGIGGNGHFGSTGSAPDGYHPRDDEGEGRIGFISDRDKDGWGNGQDDGDFFVPGTPFEGFSVDVGGTSYFNNHEDTDIPRQSEVTYTDSDRQQSTWVSEVMPNGLQVTQVATVPVNDQRLDVTVTLANTSSDTVLTDVYYSRQVDNDANVYACREFASGWSSLNTVVAQADTNDAVSLVSSIMMDDCNDSDRPTDLTAPHSYLGLISTDSRSRAGIEQLGFYAKSASAFYGGGEVCREGYYCDTVMVERGSNVFHDSGIGLSFNVGQLPAGASETLTFSYILSPAQAQEIIDAHAEENEIVAPELTAEGASFSANVNRSFTTGASWFTALGGDISYFSVSPELPDGLSLDLSTGEISGTPTEMTDLVEYALTAHNLAGTSSVEFILGVDGIEPLTCESVGGFTQVDPQDPQSLNIVLLSKYRDTSDLDQNQTDADSDSAIARILCDPRAPVALATTFFDGGDGSEIAWENALADTDVLVLPETESELLGSDLLQTSGMAYLAQWVRDGGRIVMVGASQHRTELENIIGIPAGFLQVEQWQSGVPVPKSNATDSLGTSLPITDYASGENVVQDLSQLVLKLDDAFYVAMDSVNSNTTSLYGAYMETSYLSAVTKFEIGRGQASYLSSNFEGVPSINWNEALLHSVYGTETADILVTESDKTWQLGGPGVYWDEMTSAASFKLGSTWASNSLTCINTPTNPAVRKVSSQGTEIICGKQFVQDGLVDAGVSAQLSRFVTKSGDWMSSNIALTNLDKDDTYQNQLWFGGSQNLSSTMRVEATSLSPNGTTNLSGEQQDSDGSSEWIVASEGAGINNVHGDSNSEVVTHIFEPRPNANHGGSGRPSWLRLDADEIQSDWWIVLPSNQSISISALTGRMSYEPGCDRTAVEISKQAARTITKSDTLIEIPLLKTDCVSFSETSENLSAKNVGTNVVLTWASVPGATHYEISRRLSPSGDWTSPTSITANANSIMSATISNLSRSTNYEFRIRAKRMNFGAYGDNAIGAWAGNVAALKTSAKPIVRKAQAAPTVPKTRKIKQTIKFTMKTKAGLALVVSSKGACKTTKITVKKKVGTKTITTQTGWLVTATKKGNCAVTLKAKGNTRWLPLSITRNVKVT